MTYNNTNSRLSRRKFVTATGTLSALGVAGCFGGGSDSNVLEVAHWWSEGDGNEAINALVEGFKEKHPDVKIDENLVSGGAGDSLRDNIRTRLLNENAPSTWQAWPGKNLKPFTDSDLLVDIEADVWDKNDMKSAYKQGPKDVSKPAGNFVTVPINIHRLNNLFYNVSVVEDAGVDPSSLSTPSDVVDAMDTIATETDAVPMAHQTQSPWSTLQLLAQVILGEYGVETYNTFTAGNLSQIETEVKDSLGIVKEYKDYFNEDAGSISWTEANQKVIEGDAAFMHQGDWAAGAYRGADGFDYESDWNHVAYPGTDGMYALNMDSFPMPANNPSPEATKKFLAYCGTKDAQKRFNPKKGSIPPRTDVSKEPFGPFLQNQMEDFANASEQPPSMTHGLAVASDVLSNLKGATKTFTSSWDVDKTYQEMTNAF